MLPILLLAPLVHAEVPIDSPESFALVVGSNRAGPGQQALHYALDDAARIASVLEEVGGVPADRVEVLEDPTADELFAAIDAFRAEIAASTHPTELTFYYSGHARAGALDLGSEAVPLDALRLRLQGLGASVTLVVLDACQSGAVSDVKGVAAAADFSTSSVGSLASEGLAIIASSTETELSQESPAIGGSFFTLHLATGLRGPADENDDGNVTLAEAYQYAYHRTLVDTAGTAVGSQHPTLETDLRGRGDLVLSRPSAASARLAFPEPLAGDVLVVRDQPEVVAAEVHKVAGESFAVALPPGRYRAVVRPDGDPVECRFELLEGVVTALEVAGCPRVRPEEVAAKGDEAKIPRNPPVETLFVEIGGGVLSMRDDDYTARLADFGFDGLLFATGLAGTWTLDAAWSPSRFVALVGSAEKLDDRDFTRDMYIGDDSEFTEQFQWNSHALLVGPRGQLPVLRGAIVPYAQVQGGLAWSVSHYNSSEGNDPQSFAGPALALAAGVQENLSIHGWRHLGFFQQAQWSTAPALRDLIGDVHDDGGTSVTIGLRAGY